MSLRFSMTIGALVFAATGLALTACGNSSDTTTSGAGGTTASSTGSTSSTSSTTASGSGGSGGSGGGTTKGPGASLKCDSSGMDAFDTYKTDAFVAVNKAIIAGVGAEITANGTANLGASFTKIGTGMPVATTDNAATFEGKLAAFLVYAYGGPTNITYTDGVSYYGPQDMVAAHTGLAITTAQYTYFITNIVVPALKSSGVKNGAGGASDPDDIGSCFAPVVTDPTFAATIVGH